MVLKNEMKAPLATDAPYEQNAAPLPLTLGAAIEHLVQDKVLNAGLGQDFVRLLPAHQTVRANAFQ